MLVRSLHARDERRRRNFHTRREGPDDLVERVRLAQNRGAVARARRNDDAPATAVARGVHAVAGGPPESDAVARRLMVPDAVVVEQAHRAPERLRVRVAAYNYALLLLKLKRFEEAKLLLRKMMPVARRVLGEGHNVTLRMRKVYAKALFKDDGATLDDVREAAATLEEIERTARRVLGGAHPLTKGIEFDLRGARAALHARETPLAEEGI